MTDTLTDLPIRQWRDRGATLLRLRLARPPANVLDTAMIGALVGALAAHRDDRHLRAVMIDAEGADFSYGASVQEHLPERCAAMLRNMHGLVLRIARFPVPVISVVRGQCLGGGLELAAAGHLIFAATGARFGQPEIRLGVFAPVASCVLPERIARMAAEDLLFSGRTIDAGAAHACGLAAAVADDPERAALDYFDRELAPRSATSLRLAVEAVRQEFCARLEARLAAAEQLYLDRLMETHDAVEGLRAFLEKRPPRWEDR